MLLSGNAAHGRDNILKILIFSAVIIFFCFFQSTILNSIKVFGVKPDLLMICVIVGSVFWGWQPALFFSLLAGLGKDIFGMEALGVNLLLFPLWAYLVYSLSKKVTLDYDLVLVVLVFVAVFLNDILIRFIFLFFKKFISLGIFLRITFIESLYTALALPLVLKALGYLKCLHSCREE